MDVFSLNENFTSKKKFLKVNTIQKKETVNKNKKLWFFQKKKEEIIETTQRVLTER